MDPAPQSPIPAAVKDLLALFDGPLAKVQFPDVDAKALSELAASVDQATEDVETAAQAWAAAKRAVDERLETLLQKAQRALSYARVYAEDKPEISAVLATVTLPRSGDARGPKPAGTAEMAPARKRGRPKKGETPAAATAAEPPPVVLLAELPEPAEAATNSGPVLLPESSDADDADEAAPAAE